MIFGSYGVTRENDFGPAGPADGTAGGRVKTKAVLPGAGDGIVVATFAGDEETAGILRLGKRSMGGGEVADNDFDLTKIFAQPGANPKLTTSNAPKHVDVVIDHIQAQRAIYVIYAEQVGGDSADITDLANAGRQSAWKSINDFVRDHIFNVDAVAPDPANATGTDAEVLEVADVTEVENLSSPLGSFFYPMTRNGRPDDDAALEQIDNVLAAFADRYAFADALEDDGGGVFDSQPALDIQEDAATAVDPFPLNDNVAQADEPVADIFGRISSQTKLFSLSTAYTRFGVWSRRETLSAVHDWAHHASPFTEDPSTETNGRDADGSEDDGSTSPGSYAYSYLDQASYRVDRPVATYPSNGLATYEGKTLVNHLNNQAFVGDALIRVTWMALTPATDTSPAKTNSTIVPIFRNFERWDDSSLDRLTHDHDGDRNVATAEKVVDEIAFRDSDGGVLTLTHDGEKLGITDTTARVEVVYTDGTSIVADHALSDTTDSTFIGRFVGSSGDGPLGILGTWKVPGFRVPPATATNPTPAQQSPRDDLTGSFGADLTSFETALP